MSENTNIVQNVYENFRTGDIKALLNQLSKDIEWQLPEIENVPFAGKRRGHEQIGQFFASLVDTQGVQHFEPREFIAHGDKVVALDHYAWHAKSTGREFGGDFAHVFTMCNGKVIRFHEYMDLPQPLRLIEETSMMKLMRSKNRSALISRCNTLP